MKDWRRIRSALKWTRSAWDRRYDPYVRKIAVQRWKRVFKK